MTERKPAGINFESWIDKQIRQACERGEFDDLPGAGKPLPNLGNDDELSWIRQKVEREGLSTEALLPPALQLRKEIERLPETVRELRSEQAVRDVVEDLNSRVVDYLRAPSGPQIPVGKVDAGEMVAQWRAQQAADGTAAASAVSADPACETTPRQRWWHRLVFRSRR